MSNETDPKTLSLINSVRQQKAEIQAAEKAVFLTNCTFSYVDGNMNSAVNIRVEKNIKSLILIAAFLEEKEISYKKTAKKLGIENIPELTWNGYSVVDWMNDLKVRINKILITEKKEKLDILEKRLESLVSSELRTKLELEQIEKELNS